MPKKLRKINGFELKLGVVKAVYFPSQLVNLTWGAEMKDGYWLGKDHPGVYLGERQALNEDYTHSGFDRGHLNPNGHHAGSLLHNTGSALNRFQFQCC